MEQKDPKLREIWNQSKDPVIFRRASPNPLAMRLPYGSANFDWLRNEKRHKPSWNADKKYWEVPVAWFDDLVHRSLKQYRSVYIIQLYRRQQK